MEEHPDVGGQAREVVLDLADPVVPEVEDEQGGEVDKGALGQSTSKSAKLELAHNLVLAN